tara:strand:+ start:65 stop:1279 length:1215 start_codon:yes stop_codon:yes gene_type:complete
MLNYSKKTSLVLLGFLLAFIILELCVRILFSFLPDQYLPSYGIYQSTDPVVGPKLIPESRGVWSKEGFSKVEINSKGWNDFERQYNKPQDVVRVAIVGDSFIEALQVPKTDSVASKIESWLDVNCKYKMDDIRYEVLSFGASGWGTTQMHLAINNEIIQYDPDFVIMAFFPGNDLKNNIYELELNSNRPYFKIENGSLIQSSFPTINNSFKRSAYTFLRDNFLMIQLIREPIVNIFWEFSREEKIKESNSEGKSNYSDRLELIDRGTWGNDLDNEFVEYSWNLFELILLKTKEDLNDKNIEFITLVVSRGEVVDNRKNEVEQWAIKNNYSNIFYPEDRVENFGKKNDIPVIAISRMMTDLNWDLSKEITYFHGFDHNLGGGHWNQNGHSLTSSIIGEKICGLRK